MKYQCQIAESHLYVSNTAIDCGVLISPVNGIVQFQSTVLFSIARYTCDHGYELNGEKERQCMANGQWSAESPTCKCKLVYTLLDSVLLTAVIIIHIFLALSKCVPGNPPICKGMCIHY